MKIFQVVNVHWYNATAWYAIHLSRLLQEAGHEVVVLTLEGTDSERRAKEMGLHTESLSLNSLNPLKLFAGIGRVISLLGKHKPDVVNCHRGEGFLIWGLLKQLGFGFKLVRTRGDQRLPKNNRINRWLHAKIADAVVVTNSRMARHFLNTMGTPEKSVWLIIGGVDTDRFQLDREGGNAIREEFGFSDQDMVLGLVARFDRVKAQKELIQAVSELYHERGLKNLRLFLIGFTTATRQEEVEEWIRESNVSEITRISGRRTDVPALISSLDVAVISSLWSEAIARSAVEIQSVGIPLVSSDVGVMPDLLPDMALYPAGDQQAMTNIIGQAVTDPKFRQELAEANANRISQLSGKDFLSQTLNLYQGLLEK